MRYKLAIISLKIGQTSPLLLNNKNCILLENNEDLIINLQETLKVLIRDESRRKQLGEYAYNTINNSQWNWDERVEAEMREVESLIEENQHFRNVR